MERENYPEDFERFWKQYPRTPIMSKKEAFTAWKKTNDADKYKIGMAVRLYSEWLGEQRRKRPDYPAVHACRFISQRRFDGFQPDKEAPAPANPLVGTIYVKPETQQFNAWNDYWKLKRGKQMPRDRGGGWWVPSEWPPQMEGIST